MEVRKAYQAGTIRQLTRRIVQPQYGFLLPPRLPAVDGRVIDVASTFEQPCSSMTRAQGGGDMATDARQHNLLGAMDPLKAHGHRRSRSFAPSPTEQENVSNHPRQKLRQHPPLGKGLMKVTSARMALLPGLGPQHNARVCSLSSSISFDIEKHNL